jgi:hypothetical protein
MHSEIDAPPNVLVLVEPEVPSTSGFVNPSLRLPTDVVTEEHPRGWT